MTTIAIISDTHITDKKFQSKHIEYLKRLLKGFDYIIHAGDIQTIEVVEELKTIAPAYFCRGNMDNSAALSEIPKIVEVEIAKKKIVICHQIDQVPSELTDSSHVLIVGHSHYPFIKELHNNSGQNLLVINPGSIFSPRTPPAKGFGFEPPKASPTMAILEIDDGICSAFIKRLK